MILILGWFLFISSLFLNIFFKTKSFLSLLLPTIWSSCLSIVIIFFLDNFNIQYNMLDSFIFIILIYSLFLNFIIYKYIEKQPYNISKNEKIKTQDFYKKIVDLDWYDVKKHR